MGVQDHNTVAGDLDGLPMCPHKTTHPLPAHEQEHNTP